MDLGSFRSIRVMPLWKLRDEVQRSVWIELSRYRIQSGNWECSLLFFDWKQKVS